MVYIKSMMSCSTDILRSTGQRCETASAGLPAYPRLKIPFTGVRIPTNLRQLQRIQPGLFLIRIREHYRRQTWRKHLFPA